MEGHEARGYHEGARRVEISFCLLSSRWQAFIRRALPQRKAYDIRSLREGLAASCDRFLDLGLQWSTFVRYHGGYATARARRKGVRGEDLRS